MAEGGALQAGGWRGQGLGLQLKGVAEGARAQTVQGLDPHSKPGEERREEEGQGPHHHLRTFLLGTDV